MLALRERGPKYGGARGRNGGPEGQKLVEMVRAVATHLRESDLSVVWERQRFPKGSLRTRDGGEVRVVYRGRPGIGPGPDFRDAIVSLPGGLAQGDVELHVRASDFRRHGHHRDAAYDGVVLHAVFIDDVEEDTVLACGRLAPVVALGAWVNDAAAEMKRWVGRGAGWGEPCRTAVTRLGERDVSATLGRLGAMRFRQKAAAFAKRLRTGERPEEILWAGLLEALGYGGEREAMVRLAAAVSWREVRAAVRAAAEGEGAIVARRLLGHGWLLLQPNVLWRAGLRPGNRPERRIEGLAQLADRFADEGLAAALLTPLDESSDPADDLLASLTVPKYIGRPRAIEIVGNAVLPLAAALCGPSAGFRYEGLLAALPLPAKYGAVRHIREAVEGAVEPNMVRQQGMLYLLRQYCTQGGCGRCPLS